ncbi:hypothetical protein GGR57DRAFT_121340 [Xylariaceae sp. FL1272]|nr:hypothetical protein GGR57DRAFT_121340 [Xylariaceae sp. FL1272]
MAGIERYKGAMEFLRDPNTETGRTTMDLYLEKQAAWVAAKTAYEEARLKALSVVQSNHQDIAGQKLAFAEWNALHAREYQTAIQAKYMDWVTNGNKFEVEYQFSIVDRGDDKGHALSRSVNLDFYNNEPGESSREDASPTSEDFAMSESSNVPPLSWLSKPVKAPPLRS